MTQPTPGQDIECHICSTKVAWIERPYPQMSDWQVCPMHAAAPELLEALETLLPMCGAPHDYTIGNVWKAQELARAAIAKATHRG